MYLKKSAGTISAGVMKERVHASSLRLDESIHLLASPDSGLPLQLSESETKLTDGVNYYNLRGQLPILIPKKLNPYFTDHLQVPFNTYTDPFLQYFFLSTIKQSGDINADPAERAAQMHFFRMIEFLSDCRGVSLDVGCDDPELGASFFPPSVGYIGLDPFCCRLTPFRVIGVGEYLPFANESIDNVVFNTSLDHILDWRRALGEARRVLKKSGTLYIASYIWTDRADLITDAVHFHHFRLYEILGALQELHFSKCETQVYESPKGDTHRHGLYLKAIKV